MLASWWSVDDGHLVAQAAVYGLGIVADSQQSCALVEANRSQIVHAVSELLRYCTQINDANNQLRNQVSTATGVPLDEIDDEDIHGIEDVDCLQENSLSAVLKLLWTTILQSEGKHPMLPSLFSLLPIQYDEVEARYVNARIVQLLSRFPKTTLSHFGNPSALTDLFVKLCETFEKGEDNIMDQGTKNGLHQVVRQLMSSEPGFSQACQQLSKEDLQRIQG